MRSLRSIYAKWKPVVSERIFTRTEMSDELFLASYRSWSTLGFLNEIKVKPTIERFAKMHSIHEANTVQDKTHLKRECRTEKAINKSTRIH